MGYDVKQIPKWYFWVTWIGIAIVIIMFATIMIYLYTRMEVIDMSLNACQICSQQTKDSMNQFAINITGYKN